jgi:putative membrane protein
MAKVTLVLLMSGLHGMFSRWRREFAKDQNRHNKRFYAAWNEVPALLMIGIVILVIVKPF